MTTETPLAATPRTAAMTYAVNEDDQITVYEVETDEAVAVCGPVPSDAVTFHNETMQRAYAALIAKLLNEATGKP